MSLAEIAIVGTATSSMDCTPWKQPNTVFWAVTSMFKVYKHLVPRIDLWFEMHHDPTKPWPDCLKWAEEVHPQWFEWAYENQPHVMMSEAHPRLENSEKYPLDKVEAEFGRYFTSSVSYMLALAITRKPKSIGIYGVDMALGEEYHYQRPGCEYLIGRAMGAGIPVKIPETSQLLKSMWLYGYDGPREPQTAREKEMSELAVWRARAIAAVKAMDKLTKERDAALRGRKKNKSKQKRRIR